MAINSNSRSTVNRYLELFFGPTINATTLQQRLTVLEQNQFTLGDQFHDAWKLAAEVSSSLVINPQQFQNDPVFLGLGLDRLKAIFLSIYNPENPNHANFIDLSDNLNPLFCGRQKLVIERGGLILSIKNAVTFWQGHEEKAAYIHQLKNVLDLGTRIWESVRNHQLAHPLVLLPPPPAAPGLQNQKVAGG